MSEELRIKDRIAKIERELKILATGQKKIHELVEEESGEEIYNPGEEVQGVKLA